MNKASISQVKTALLDLIFPKFCFGCGQEDIWLCQKCQQKIILVKTQVCPICGKISQNGQYCPKCRFDEFLVKVKNRKKPQKLKRRKPLQGIVVASYYQEGPVKELIHNFKYNHILALKNFLGEILAEVLAENFPIKKDLLVTAIPLHFFRRSQRGYNQAELLADVVANKLKIEKNFQILRKIRYTKPQVKTGGKKRLKNLENSFKFYPNINTDGKTIILVDDVATTGTTLNECAQVLRSTGATRVWGLVVARG